MNPQSWIFFFFCFASLTMSLIVSWQAWRQRRYAGARTFALMSLLQAVWTFGYIAELAAMNIDQKAFWDSFQYIGSFSIPVAMLIFAREYGQTNLPNVNRWWLGLLAVPIIYVVLVYIDPYGPLARVDAVLLPITPETPFGSLEYEYPRALYWMFIYSYLTLVVALGLLVRRILTSRGVFRTQMMWVTGGFLIPIVMTIGTLTGTVSIYGQRDISPITFGISSVVVLTAMARYRLFDLVPVARERVAEIMRDGVMTLDSDNRLVDFNPASRQMFSLQNTHFGKPIHEACSWLPTPSHETEITTDVQIGTSEHPLYYSVNMTPLKDRSEQYTGTLVLVRDITARACAEKALQAQNKRLEISSDISKRMTLAQNEQQLLDAISPLQFAQAPTHIALSYSREEDETLIGVDLVAMQDAEGRAIPLGGVPTFFPLAQFGQILDNPLPTFTENVMTANITDDARAIVLTFGYYAQIIIPLRSAGRVQGLLSFSWSAPQVFDKDLRDLVTDLGARLADNILARRTFIEVQKARAELETLYSEQVKVAEKLRAVDTMKSQFLASMSHELRTPLNAILNFTEFVATGMLGEVNDEQVDALNKALDSGRHLLSLINDVLDITKIESGMMKLFIEHDIDIHAELGQVIATAETLINDKPGVKFIKDIDAPLPKLAGDRRRLRQILLNLISNAVKFTEEGSVTLSVKQRGDSLLFAVIDTGPGIEDADKTMIFEPFRQTETGIRHANGTGLGLPISKRLVESHHGRLWVESEHGEGSAFYFTIPLERTEEQHNHPEPLKA